MSPCFIHHNLLWISTYEVWLNIVMMKKIKEMEYLRIARVWPDE